MLELLRAIVDEVCSAQTVKETFDIVVERVQSSLKTEICSLYYADHHSQNYLLMANRGFKLDDELNVTIPFHKGLVGLVGEREEPITLSNASRHENYLLIPEIGEEDFDTFLGVPIVHRRQILGILVVQERHQRQFGPEHESFLVTLSAQLAGILAYIDVAELITAQKPFHKTTDFSVQGIPGVAGIAIGDAFLLSPPANLDKVPDRKTDEISYNVQHFQHALEAARKEVSWLGEQLGIRLPKVAPALFDAYKKILASDSLGTEVEEEIRKGWWSATALKRVINSHARALEKVKDPYLKERAADLRDLGRRVLCHLESKQRKSGIDVDNPCVIIADEISAAMLAEVPKEKLLGIVSLKGSLTSHVTILAKALNVPAVLGLPNIDLSKIHGNCIVVDGYSGRVIISPGNSLKREYNKLLEEEKRIYLDLETYRDKPTVTADGYKIPLFVNTGLYADLVKSRRSGVSGIGLYRTEIPFMQRDNFPSEKEQIQIYREALQIFQGSPVKMRTLDVGADKELSYFHHEEPNPYLGWRGIRITLDHPELFLVQLRAMLKASESLHNLEITLPMISHVDEIDEAKAFIRQAYNELLEENPDADIAFPKIGAMIEVPSAVIQAKDIAKRVDFFSIGSNDLAQYILAVDRHNNRVADRYDGLHPAVIRSVHAVINVAKASNIEVNLCGEIAGDPMGAMVYIGLGIDGLSMNAASMPRIKKTLNHYTHSQLTRFALTVIAFEKTCNVRQYLLEQLASVGLDRLVRAGVQ
ncbi:MAG: phosphoenolpyruvate--protein phosphotransferase [Pseudomonadota bacterium]